jgi:hypothetical protein
VAKLKESSKEASDSPRNNEDVENEKLVVSNWYHRHKTNAHVLFGSSNVQNDTLLHRLVHTKLLSGSLNPELDLTAAQRRKALAGRVLELAGDSKLGKGESNVRQEERKRASKGVRDGMVAKQKERDVKSLTEVWTTYSFRTSFLCSTRQKTWETIILLLRDYFQPQVAPSCAGGTVD